MTIYILHQNRYWTEYLAFLLKDPTHFQLVTSDQAVEPYEPGHNLEQFAPKQHQTILAAGTVHEKTENANIILRFMHSPGFYLYPMLKGYANLVTQHKGGDYRFLLSKQYYEALILKDFSEDVLNQVKDQLISDPKVSKLAVDVNMVRLKEAQATRERRPGTALLALTWLLIDNDYEQFYRIAKFLKQKVKVSILLHPLMRLHPASIEAIKKLEGELFEKVYYNLPRDELTPLYDEHEFIVSDGSGSCYEALIRGCMPYAVRGLRTVPIDEPFDEVLDEEYFPFPDYREIGKEKFKESAPFITRYFPYLNQYKVEEAEEIAKQEILELPFN